MMTINEMIEAEKQMTRKVIDTSSILRNVMRKGKVFVIVEDDKDIVELVSNIIKSHGETAIAFDNVTDAIKYIEEVGGENIRCCLIDLKLPRFGGNVLIDYIERKHKHIPMIINSCHTEMAYAIQKIYPSVQVVEKGALGYVSRLEYALGLKNCERSTAVS